MQGLQCGKEKLFLAVKGFLITLCRYKNEGTVCDSVLVQVT